MPQQNPRPAMNPLVRVSEGGDWIDPKTVIRVKVSAGYSFTAKKDTHTVAVHFKDGDWSIECGSREEAVAVRDRIAALRNEAVQSPPDPAPPPRTPPTPRQIKVWYDTGYDGGRRATRVPLPADWEALTEDERSAYLDNEAISYMSQYVNFGAEVADDGDTPEDDA